MAVLAGVVGTMTLRVLTVDLTEGQALVRYWWGWAICFGLLVFGSISVNKGKK